MPSVHIEVNAVVTKIGLEYRAVWAVDEGSSLLLLETAQVQRAFCKQSSDAIQIERQVAGDPLMTGLDTEEQILRSDLALLQLDIPSWEQLRL